MKRNLKFWSCVIACGIALTVVPRFPLQAQQTNPRARTKTIQQRPARPEIWRSETTGKEYRVRIDKDLFYAEWVNIPPDAAQRGQYIRTECRRAGSKWVGTSSLFMPCSVGTGAKEQIENMCHLTVRIEIDSITPSRITGHGESLRDFDCRSCKILQTGWAAFVWVPKK